MFPYILHMHCLNVQIYIKKKCIYQYRFFFSKFWALSSLFLLNGKPPQGVRLNLYYMLALCMCEREGVFLTDSFTKSASAV